MTEAPSPTTEIAQRTPQQQLIANVRTEEFKQQVEMALPENIPAHRFQRAAVTALMTNPELANADHNSVFSSLVKCAQDGLMPDGREAALVIFGGKATYMPMIGGFRKIAAEHGWSIRTAVVYENDEFDHELGLEPRLIHRPVRPGMERGGLQCAYAIATHRDGRKEIEVMTAADVAKVREISKSKNSGPWRDWTERMWEKTVGRRLFAKLPLDPHDQERIARVMNATAILPEDAAVALYGPDAARDTNDLNGSSLTPDEQPAPPTSASPSSEAAPASPVDEEPSMEPEPEPGDPATFVAPDAVQQQILRDAAAAGETLVPDGQNKGRTIQQVAAAGPQGRKWIGWALEKHSDPMFRAAVAQYVQVHLPDLAGGAS